MAIRYQATVKSGRNYLPPETLRYLQNGVLPGGRNKAVYDAAQQFFANKHAMEDAIAAIMPRALTDGLKEKEILSSIRNGYNSTEANEPCGPGAGPSMPIPATKTARVKASKKYTFRDAIEAAFLPEEVIAICAAQQDEEGGEWRPSFSTGRKRESWLKSFDEDSAAMKRLMNGNGGGVYICINPVSRPEDGHKNDNVAKYRHVLVEWDNIDIESQIEAIQTSGFPVTVVILSGGDSVHAWVRVDAETKEEWERRKHVVYELFEKMGKGVDTNNSNPARLSRCPGAMRGDKEQKVLDINLGPKTWAEWESKAGKGLPGILSMRQFRASAPKKPAPLIAGLLYPGCKMTLGSSSKGRKSWVLLDLAMAVASGRDWLGMKTRRGRALYINFELLDWMAFERMQMITAERGMDEQAEDLLHVWNLRGFAAPFTELIPQLLERIHAGEPYDLVIVDPLYKGLGDEDENTAGDMNRLLGTLEGICTKTGAALAIAHHFAKGDPWEKEPLDRLSGSGVFGRDPDTAVILTPGRVKREKGNDDREGVIAPEEKGKKIWMDCIVRGSAPLPSCWLRWGQATLAPEGVQKVREYKLVTGKAATHGDTIKRMPPLARHASVNGKYSENCPTLLWIVEKCGVELSEAFSIWNNLRQPKYSIMVFENGLWRGSEYDENAAF